LVGYCAQDTDAANEKTSNAHAPSFELRLVMMPLRGKILRSRL
jgi:hypothetical protein